MANNFIRERATESKTIHILQHLGQWLSLSAFFWYRIAAVVFNIPLSYGLHSLQLLICVSVRRHKQGFMQRQHFSILFLNQLIINIDHWWLPYYLYFSLFSLILILSSLFCVDLSKTLFQTLQGEGENGSELQRQQQGTVFLLEQVWGQEQKSAGSFVLCFCGIIAQLWWHTNSVFYF